jgi:chorismate synthase
MFGDPANTDLTGDYFTSDTDFDLEDGIGKSTVLYHHGQDATLKRRKLGRAALRTDEVGVWIEAQLKLRDDYESAIYGLNLERDEPIKKLIDTAGKDGDTLGGIVEVRVDGLPFGLGTHAQWDRKLDGRLAQAVMAVQAIKGVEIGLGFEAARRRGSQVHDPIQYDESQRDTPNLGFTRPTNNAGGLEAGMTNGQPLVIRAAKKPISTLAKPLESININTKEKQEAQYERSDVCAVSAASVIVENVVAFEVACALVDKFGGDSLPEMQARWKLYLEMARSR